MTRRGTVTGLRGTHPYAPDPTVPGCCQGCGLPRRNELHRLPPASAEARAYDARLTGDHDDDGEPPW
jgi:hypothetical protein